MAKDSDHLAGARDADNSGGLLSGLLAEENEFDRRSLWRIGSWGFGAVGAVFIAVMANQSSLGWRREQVAAADLARQAQQLQALARDSRNETRQLASAIDTLNSDRDRLYSRVTVLEQGLDSVTGAIAKQSAAASAPQPAASNMPAGASPALDGQPAPQTQAPPPAPIVGPVASMSPPSPPEKSRDTAKPAPNASAALTAAAEKPREAAKPTSNVAMAIPVPAPAAAPASASAPTPLGPAKSMMGPPDPAAPKMIEPPKETAKPSAAAMAAVPPEAPQSAKEPLASDADAPQAAIQRTEFAVDLGSASSIGGLRALWRGILKTNAELAALHPIIVIKESTTGLGMQLRLAAGPLQDAAAAAKICAALLESQRGCETTVFDGQRLAMAADEAQPDAKGDAKRDAKGPPAIKPVPAKRGYYPKHAKDDTPPKAEGSTLSSWFGSASAKK